MADQERELKIKATADASQAKAEVSSLNETLGENATAQAEAAAATAASAEATAEATFAEARRDAILKAQAATLAELRESQIAAATAVSEMASLAEAGGKKYALAIDAAASAVARLEIATDAVRARGGPIGPEVIAQLEAYDAAVAAAAAGTEKAAGSSKLLGAEAALMRGNVGSAGAALKGLATETGSLGAAFAKLALPFGAVIGVFTLLPLLAEKVAKGWDQVTSGIGRMIASTDNATTVLDKHGKEIDKLSDKYQTSANEAAEVVRAEYAIAQGFVVATDNITKNVAAVELHKAALHGWSLETAEAEKALKSFGIKLPLTFDEAKQASNAFIDAYTAALTKGSAYAYAFLDANTSTIKKLEKDFADLGTEVPANLKKLGDSVGVYVETAIKKTEELQKKHAETIDASKAKLKELSEAEALATAKKLDDYTKLEAARTKSLASVAHETATTIANLQEQVKETEKAHADRSISDSEYFQKINGLIAAEAKAKADGYEKEKQINADSAKDEKTLADKFALEQEKVRDERVKNQEKIADEEKASDKLNLVLNAQLKAYSSITPQLLAAGAGVEYLGGKQAILTEATDTGAKAQHALAIGFSATTAAIPGLESSVDALTGKLRALEVQALAAAKAVASVPDGGSGGG